MPRMLSVLACLVIVSVPTAWADDEPVIAMTNMTLYTGVGDRPIEKAVLIVQGKKIVAAGANIPVPAGATVHDLKGAVVIPGLVDTHSHIGIYPKPSVPAHSDGNEGSGPVQPGLRAVDAVWPADPGIRMALAGGVTTVNIMPGSANVIGGQTIYVKLRGSTVDAMRIMGKLPDGTTILGGLKMANGENPKGYGKNRQQAPFTRMKVAALQREQFVKAREYKAKRDAGEKVDRDLTLDPLVEVLEKKRTVHFHCHRADDLMTALRIADEFGFEIVLQHATEAYRVPEEIAKQKVPVSLTLVDSPGGKAETIGRVEENAAFLDKAGIPVTINTDDSVTESRFYLRTGAMAVRGGLSEMAALRALTSTPAKVLHLDHRLGSLEAGKDADFVVLSGPPFSVYSKVQQTWIEGVRVFDAADEGQRAYRDGGFAVPRGTTLPTIKTVVRPEPVSLPPQQAETLEAITPGLYYIRAGRIYTGSGEPIKDGAIIVEAGKIRAVGPAAQVKRPFGAQTLRAVEVTPGFIDAMGVAGLSGAWNIPADQDQDELGEPNQADLRVVDGYNPNELLIDFLRANGVAVTHSTPGRAAVLAGTSGVFRCRGGTAEEAALARTFAVVINLGEAPKEAGKGKGPQTRMAVAAIVRKAFSEAQTYAAKRKADPKTPLNPKLEPLVPALQGTAPVLFEAHRADDIQTALRIIEEFQLKKPVLGLGTESWMMADELAKLKIPVIVHPTMQRAGSSMETLNTLLGTAATLKAKGIPIAIGTSFEGYVPKIRHLRSEAAMAAANGLGSNAALQAITIDAAKILGIDKEHGSIEPGKVADLVLFDGDPLEHATHVTHTILGGRVVFRREDYLALPLERRFFASAGESFGVGCCLGW